MDKVSDSGRLRHPLLESRSSSMRSSSMSSGSRKYLWLDELIECEREFQSSDGVINTPTGKYLGNDIAITDGIEESNPRFQSQLEIKDQI